MHHNLLQPTSSNSKALQPTSSNSKALQPTSSNSKALQPISSNSKALQPNIILPPLISIPSSSQNTKNIKTIYRNARIEINKLLEKLIEALEEKHKVISHKNYKFKSFERKAKKLKTKLMDSRNNLNGKYIFIGDMTDLFDEIIKFLHKMKPRIERSIKKKEKEMKDKRKLQNN